jgi:hypothetical protein
MERYGFFRQRLGHGRFFAGPNVPWLVTVKQHLGRSALWAKMIQTVVTYLLAGTMLICPYMCFEQMAGKSAAPCATGSCCCHDQCPSPDGQGPEEEDRDNTQPDCLCHGAIVAGTKIEHQAPPADFYVGRATDQACKVGAIGPFFEPSLDGTHPCHFPPLASGREICALRGSLLL